MTGKESDIKLAIELREKFINTYNDDMAFNELLSRFEKGYMDKLIHKLTKEIKISAARNYKMLKDRIINIRECEARELFVHICQIDEARIWINDNGKYTDLAFEAAYCTIKNDEELLKAIG